MKIIPWFTHPQAILGVNDFLFSDEYIYIYAFSRRFYLKRLQCIQAIHFCQYVCPLGIELTTFCAANAMLYHWATGTSELHKTKNPGSSKLYNGSESWSIFWSPKKSASILHKNYSTQLIKAFSSELMCLCKKNIHIQYKLSSDELYLSHTQLYRV